MVQKTIIILWQENPEKISHESKTPGKGMKALQALQRGCGALWPLSGVVEKTQLIRKRRQRPSQYPVNMGDGQSIVCYGHILLLGSPYPAEHLLAVDHAPAAVDDELVAIDSPVQVGPCMHVKG